MGVSLKDPQDGDLAEVSDINVTPFIDVILVLLIIFMVAAPLSTVDVPVDLPVSNAQPQPRPDKPVFLTVKNDLSLALGNDEVPRAGLQATLDRQTGNDREQRVFLRADGAVAYRELMNVMNLLRQAGYLKIALVGLEDTGGSAPTAPPAASPEAPRQP
ncbi:Biopolymer transport protein ExbD [bacterium YEK0313]|nr:Biopolymer transport protein ExbD [bacterium YEK0313]